mgnify:CR=1 FL=1
MNKNLIPAAIVLAGILIAGAIIFTNYKVATYPSKLPPAEPEQPSYNLDKVSPITKEDWYRGDLNASVKIIEYSDLECPFCKMAHPTLIQLVKNYQGKVAWIYRHFPLTSLHPKAINEAEAAECVGYLGGNNAFWLFVDKIFATTPSNNGLDLSLLPKIAEESGVNRVNFQNCLNSGKYRQEVEKDLNEAQNIGLTGTPSFVIIGPNNKKEVIIGARNYDAFKNVIDSFLENQ